MTLFIDYILTHEGLETAWGSHLPKASEKGYPGIYDKMCYWVLYEDNLAIAYTSSLVMSDKYAFVGNTYVRKEYRSKGLHSLLLDYRNNAPHMKGLTKITVVNPTEDSKMEHLTRVVSRLGYKKVQDIDDISDIIPEWLYEDISNEKQEIWRLDYDNNRQSNIIRKL